MANVKDFRDLEVWQVAMDVATLALQAAAALPGSERFALGAQLRTAAVSIPSNIAEGYARASTRDYARFLKIARGSACELLTLLLLLERVQLLPRATVVELTSKVDRVRAMLHRLIVAVERSSPTR